MRRPAKLETAPKMALAGYWLANWHNRYRCTKDVVASERLTDEIGHDSPVSGGSTVDCYSLQANAVQREIYHQSVTFAQIGLSGVHANHVRNGVESLQTFEQNQPALPKDTGTVWRARPGEILQSALTTFAYTLVFLLMVENGEHAHAVQTGKASLLQNPNRLRAVP
jgi:hypothetical protein